MKLNLLGLVIFLLLAPAYGQEICDNAIDDDGDGLIDLNDEECDCMDLDAIENLIPNHSFEDRSCCPEWPGALGCANDWVQASIGTSDYFNTCDFVGFWDPGIPEMPLPGASDSEGFVGLGIWSDLGTGGGDYNEYIGTNTLLSPLLAGTSYKLRFFTALGMGDYDFDFSLFGSPSIGDLPFYTNLCPEGVGSWELLANTVVISTPDYSWKQVEMVFTPTVDIYAIALGPACENGADATVVYRFIDELKLLDSESFSTHITQTGSYCYGDAILIAEADAIDGTWQWYKDGVALIGENSGTLDISIYGLGFYTVVFSNEDGCMGSSYELSETDILTADFEYTTVCPGEMVNFTNTSTYPGEDIPTWSWDFAGDGASGFKNPIYTFSEAGTYTVQLIGTVESGCHDTIEIEVTVDPNPTASFDVIYTQLNDDCKGTATVEVSFVNTSTDLANPDSPDADATFYWNLDSPDGEWQMTHDYYEVFDTVFVDHQTDYYPEICLVAITVNGCIDTTCKVLTIYEPIDFIPVNVFSPNNDNLNDEFTFKHKATLISDFKCVIVDRWGVVIKEFNDINDTWDGTFNDFKCTDGVYFYTYEAYTITGLTLEGQGTIQLIDGAD
ncbi:MAG: gliding motility-associated C-terminal domain-containing protein [Crocinitomix sp.]|nr:gliding motility-associated C-terminal domain-containing protein [Crocinitomix sp.]